MRPRTIWRSVGSNTRSCSTVSRRSTLPSACVTAASANITDPSARSWCLSARHPSPSWRTAPQVQARAARSDAPRPVAHADQPVGVGDVRSLLDLPAPQGDEVAKPVELTAGLVGRDVDGSIQEGRHQSREPPRESVARMVDPHAPFPQRAVAAHRERAVCGVGAGGRQRLPGADVDLLPVLDAAEVALAHAARRIEPGPDDQRDLARRAQGVEVEALAPAREAGRDRGQHVSRLVHGVVVPRHEHLVIRPRRRLAAKHLERCLCAHDAGPSDGARRRRSNSGSARHGLAAGRSLLTFRGKRGGRFSRKDRAPSSASAEGPRWAM